MVPPGVIRDKETSMPRSLVAFVSSFFVLAAPSFAAEGDFVAWARARLTLLDASNPLFRALDDQLGHARLFGMGESVHETEPFLPSVSSS